MRFKLLFIGFVFSLKSSWAQKTDRTVDFNRHHVLSLDLGISPAPFNIRYPFTEEVDILRYKNNFKPILGIAYAYRWVNFRLAFPVMSAFRNKARYGTTEHFSLGFDYAFQHLYSDFDFRLNVGYALKDAVLFDTTLNDEYPNALIPTLGSVNLSANLWYFNREDFEMNALQGKRAHFIGEVRTWYLKGTINFFGISNGVDPLIPQMLHDIENSKTKSSVFSSLDFGVIPGYAYANRFKNWQFSGWMGLGPVIQTKFFALSDKLGGFIGLAPRYDIRFVGGYSTEKYFLFLAAHFDNKSIYFQKLGYNQYFYTLRIMVGTRIAPKKGAASIHQKPQ
ncbi:MAG: DUF4421 family protein [Bacteroidetes bacterium]|nr:DUF4421 family protein [Bacteroidota bacterium]